MKKTLLAAMAVVVFAGHAFTADAVISTSYCPTTRTVQVPCRRKITERVMVPCTRTEWVNETYTTTETRWATRPDTRMRKRTTTVVENRPRTVNRRVWSQTCDECGMPRSVCTTHRVTEIVPVRRRVCVDEPYTVNVRYKISVPVTKTRRVKRQVPSTREVVRTRYVTEMVDRTVTEWTGQSPKGNLSTRSWATRSAGRSPPAKRFSLLFPPLRCAPPTPAGYENCE
jgi:hypothetical protein